MDDAYGLPDQSMRPVAGPRTAAGSSEERAAKIFSVFGQVLLKDGQSRRAGDAPLTAHTNFFEAGGDSLRAALCVIELRKSALTAHIEVAHIYQCPRSPGAVKRP
jgi:hypothetical protein